MTLIPLAAHSLVLIVDSLALMNAFARANGSFTLATMTQVLKAATASRAATCLGSQGKAEGDTLKTVANGLGKLFLEQADFDSKKLDTNGLNISNTWWKSEPREKFHQALEAIRTAIGSGTPCGVVFLSRLTAAALQSAASNPDALATRCALRELDPFAVIGDNSLCDKFNRNGELGLYTPATGKGFTTEWIADRAGLLKQVLARNLLNRADSVITGDTAYKDLTRKIDLGPITLPQSGVIFGIDRNDSIRFTPTRGDKVHLYGMAGNDILTGYASADYLEGGAGDDLLRGGDCIDTYHIGSGLDTIYDSDGLGRLLFAGVELTGSLTRDGIQLGRYASSTRPELVINFIGTPGEHGNLVIAKPGGPRVIVQNWQSGDLNLTLADSTDTRTFTDLTGTPEGDISRLSTLPHGTTLVVAGPNQKVFGLGGADLIELGFDGDIGYGGAGNDIITNGDGTDHVTTGGTGNVLGLGPGFAATDLKLTLGALGLQVGDDAKDTIHFESFDASNSLATRPFGSVEFEDGGTLTYADLLALGFDIDGTDGHDTLTGSGVTDRIIGSAGDDTLSGLGGGDKLDGGAGNDSLTGGAGSDLLDGRGGNNTLGGMGRDGLLIGGAGNDAAADLMQGEAHADTYLFGCGSGADTITEGCDSVSTDILRLCEEIAGSMARIESRCRRDGEKTAIAANMDRWKVAA